MRIVLDLQAYQSPGSRRRGIGRYSLALAKAMAADARGHEIILLLNAAMGDATELIRSQFDGLLPQARIRTWEAVGPVAQATPANAFRRGASERLRVEAIKALRPDVVHVSSLFEGFTNEVVGTVPGDSPWLNAVTLYDLIPLVHKSAYLPTAEAARWYAEKIEHLRRADLLLGISRYSCSEAGELLHIPAARLANISGAADEIFVRQGDTDSFRYRVMSRYGLWRPFVMYTGGFDSRKNIGALIRAFALLPPALRCAHQLVIVGDPPPRERAELDELVRGLELGADEVVFAGYVPDDDLVKLYNICALYVFPSLQEGFGLPALEAMCSGAVVIGSNTSSLPEVIGCEEALFDPYRHQAIAAKMIQALTDESMRARLLAHAERQCREFSWRETARRALDAFELAVERRRGENRTAAPSGAAEQKSMLTARAAFLPAPRVQPGAPLAAAMEVYADADCDGVAADGSLESFARAYAAGDFGRVVLELGDDVYCAKTLGFAAEGAVDIVVRDRTFGKPLHALAQSEEGRAIVLALLYASGGYPALKAAIDGEFAESIVGPLVNIDSLTTLGRSQVVAAPPGGDLGGASMAWRDAARHAIDALVQRERAVHGPASPGEGEWQRIASALAANAPASRSTPQWLVDISNLAVHDAGTGIQRVVRHVLDELMASPPAGFRVEPVRLGDDGILRYAYEYCARRYFPGYPLPPDEAVACSAGDVYLGLDLGAHLVPQNIELFRGMRNRGVQLHFVVYDLLPLLRPDCFDPPGLPLFRAWYEAVAEVADGALCISAAVADELECWLHQCRPERLRPLGIGWFHLGADLAPTVPSAMAGEQPDQALAALGKRPTFLMVGTVEPRKGHAQALAAFEELWGDGVEVNLVVIGKRGWLVDDLLASMASHPMRGERFFWFERADDQLLLSAYRRASALIMASEGEGFGLPLIEAAHHGVPLLARDLPVFREIAAEHALYFAGYEAEAIAVAVRRWLDLDAEGQAPQSAGMTWNTWKKATDRLVEVIQEGHWTHRWMPTPLRRYAAFDYRLAIEAGRLERGRIMSSGCAGILLQGPRVPYKAGRYVLSIAWGGKLTGTVEVCSADGTRIHAERSIAAADVRVGEADTTRFDFVLNIDVKDLEIRIRANDGDEGWIAGIEVQPVVPAQGRRS
ncbi:glycosyltransferase family 4 protein [Dyella thiooxydans]|uniref:glycosyltransferase family 4 protein n=1 Tax=Dyella thiooxydans TaxID=445710 RepID=UPI001470F6F4|nr:glycosyltransferase family 1 protein [Dyella thiooxydans]